MNRKQDVTLYIIVSVIGILIFGGTCWGQELLLKTSWLDRVRVLSDACLVPAVILCGIGGLVFISNNGLFRMLSFGTKRIISHLSKTSTFREEYKDYYDYYMDKEGHKAAYGYVLYPGLVFLALSIIFMFVYNYLS